MKKQTIVITGFMASGKTTVAEELARSTGNQAIDLDREVARREGQSVCDIIKQKGEAFFRRAETRALKDILEVERVGIIALGGGAWAIKYNRALIAERDCCSVWLDAPLELCWQRIAEANCGDGENRPLARDYDGTKKLYQERRPLYALAKIRIDADAGRTAQAIAAEIVARCGEK